MLKSKASLERWAKEIIRCEGVLENSESCELEKQQAEWKIESIMELYGSDFEATLMLVAKIEEMFQKGLTN